MRPIDIVRRLCPRARPEYLAAFEAGDAAIAAAGITTPARLAHFLAQVMHETDGLTITVENGNYSAGRIVEVWPSRFPSIAAATPYAHSPEKLFNKVYGNRMGNGPPETGDGYRFRGRGILQTTGRESYRKYGLRCGVDFEGDPDLVLTAEHALKPALAEWVDGGCNAMADAGDLRGITKRINGGAIGLESRRDWHRRVAAVIGAGMIDRPRTAPVATPAASVPSPATPVPKGVAAAPVAAAVAVAGGVEASGYGWGAALAVALGVAAAIGVVIWFVRGKK